MISRKEKEHYLILVDASFITNYSVPFFLFLILVVTTLNREGMPLIRYRTGDVATLIRRPCVCGASTLMRIGRIPKRVALIAEIGNKERIYTSLFDEALYTIPDLVDYRVFLSRKDGRDSMLLKVEILGEDNNIEERVISQLLQIPPVRKSLEKLSPAKNSRQSSSST